MVYVKKTYRYLFFFIFCSCSLPSLGQNLANRNWYFGSSAFGIQFNEPKFAATLAPKPAMPLYGSGGGAVATDPVSGDLLFYTDGVNVYDRNHALMGTGLSGDKTRNQAAAICRVPGTTLAAKNKYYIFTNSAAGIQYSIVDMGVGGSFPTPFSGQVTTTNSSIFGLPAGLSEAMIIIPNADGENFWLVLHSNTTNDFYIVPINNLGFASPFITITAGILETPANFAYNPATKKLAVSPKIANRNIEIFRFDDTGPLPVISLDNTLTALNLPTAASQAIYDTEWSIKGDYLYASVYGYVGAPANIQADVLQFDLTPPIDLTKLPKSVLRQPNTILKSFGLQMGLDSAIYHLYEGTSGKYFVGKITDTDSTFNKVVYIPQAFKKGPAPINFFNANQFPSFAAKDTIGLAITFETRNTCTNSVTSFLPTVTPAADSLVWDFGDGTKAKEWEPTHTYQASGVFNVTVKAFLNGNVTVFKMDVTIVDFKLQVSLVQDTTGCSVDFPFPKNKSVTGCKASGSTCFSVKAQISGTASTTQWYGPPGLLAGQTTATLSPDSAGYYYVVATDASVPGCQAYAGVNIKEYGVQDLRSNIWHFGDKAGIDFNPVFRTPSSKAIAIPGPLNTVEGCSDICDRNGQVIFSTDGKSIYDRTKTDITPIPIPPGLGGDQDATQSAIIIPVPGDETLYYIFTTQPAYGSNFELRYSLFDLKQGANGKVTQYNKLLFTKSTERLASSGGWLIAHEYGNNAFRAYSISGAGIGNPVITNIGSDHSFAPTALGQGYNAQGYMKFGNQNILAVTLSTPGVSNVIEMFDFNNTTGVLTNFRVADSKISAGQIYGIEFAGNKLLATIRNKPTSTLVEFSIDSLKKPHLISPPAAPITGELGAIQIGPDQQYYVAINDSPSLGIINVNSNITKTSTVNVNGLPLKGATSKLGLPNFIQIIGNPAQGPSLNVSGFCLGSPTDFTGSGTDPIDTLTWSFGDGTSVKGVNLTQVSHTYATAKKYTVVLKISNRCVGFIKNLTQDIEIFKPPLDPSTTVILCSTAQPLDANPTNASGLTYSWSTGDTTKIIKVNQGGNFNVNITNMNGCSTNGKFNVASPLPQPIDLGPDADVCSLAGANKVLTTNINIPNHAWTLNGTTIAGNTSGSQVADLSTPGTFKYKVVFTLFNGCQSTDSVTYVVRQSPNFTLAGNTIACGANTGQLTINVSQPATNPFAYSITGPASASGQKTGSGLYVVPTPATTFGVGTYFTTITDQISQCSTSKTTGINSSSFMIPPLTPQKTCTSIKQPFSIVPATAFSYRVLKSTTGLAVDSGPQPPPPIETQPLLPGDYTLEVTSAGCPVTQDFSILPLPLTSLSLNSTTCTNQQVTASLSGPSPSPTFNWSSNPAGGISATSNSGATSTVTVNPGQWELTIKASDGVKCEATNKITVMIETISPDFKPSTCVNPVVLTATPNGSYIYDWYNFGPPRTPLTGNRQISVTQSATYGLYVQGLISGCAPTGPVEKAIDVNLLGKLTVSLNPINNGITPCTGTPFELNAKTNRLLTSYTWTLNTKLLDASLQNINPLTGRTAEGNYKVVVSDGTCSATDNVSITLATPSSGNLISQALICPQSEETQFNQVILKPGSEFKSYTWFKNDTEIVGYTDSTYTAVEPAKYKVEFMNLFGCISSQVADVSELCDPKITAPTGFKPTSGVKVNETFRIFHVFVSKLDFKIFIFNRWGEMVYESNDRDFTWDGSYNGSGAPLPPGTYSYLVKFKSEFPTDQRIKEKHGGVMLLR